MSIICYVLIFSQISILVSQILETKLNSGKSFVFFKKAHYLLQMAIKPVPRHILSKSTFLRGMQCEKSLWMYKNEYHLREETSAAQQAIFSRGTDVGVLARDLFPGGADASPIDSFHYQQSVIKTQELIHAGHKAIYEAAFQHEQVLAAIDILVNDSGKWFGYEVKSSTEVKDVNILDAALQYYVITKSGIQIEDIFIVHINNQYVRKGAIDLSNLFIKQSVKKEVLELQEYISEKISELKQVSASKVKPVKDIGAHCSNPYNCDFMSHCWSHIPEVSIFDLVRLNTNKKFKLYADGILEFSQLHEGHELTESQQMQVKSYLDKKDYIDISSIRSFLSTIKYPVYFMDFETFQSAIPMFDNSKPYQQIVFQFSVHFKENRNGELIHYEFLAEANGEDPREGFIKALLEATKSPGTILAYNQSFEISRLKELSEDYPQYKNEIAERISRIKDLMIPFSKRWYYSPQMNGSYSIKAVLPALVPELSYKDLAIGDGGSASAAYLHLFDNKDAIQVESVRNSLYEYCKMDTLAMVRLLEVLTSI